MSLTLTVLRQIVLTKVEDEEVPHSMRVHNSLTVDGLSMPNIPKGKTVLVGKAALMEDKNVCLVMDTLEVFCSVNNML